MTGAGGDGAGTGTPTLPRPCRLQHPRPDSAGRAEGRAGRPGAAGPPGTAQR